MQSRASKTLCFDLDGVLCTNTWGEYEEAEPIPWAIERVNALAEAGHRIVVFTARGTATGIDWEPLTREQLERWGVAYDELSFGKPSADVYIDDRAVHSDAWRWADAHSLPGLRFGEEVDEEWRPSVPPTPLSAVSETGRTFGRRPFLAERHAERALARAAALGIGTGATSQELVGDVELALGAAPDSREVVFTITLTGPPSAAHLDTPEAAATSLGVFVRPLREATAAVVAFSAPDASGPAVIATLRGQSGAWPLLVSDDRTVADGLGGDLAVVVNGALVVRGEGAGVAGGYLAELATGLGETVERREPSATELEQADEVLVAAFPFCVLPVASVDGRPPAEGAPGPLARGLLDAWSADVGVDLIAETSEVASR